MYLLLNIRPRSNRSRALQFSKPCSSKSSVPVPSSAMTRDRSSTVYRQCILVIIWHPGPVPCTGTLNLYSLLHTVSVPCTCTMYMHPVSVPCAAPCTVYIYPVPCTNTLYTHPIRLPCTFFPVPKNCVLCCVLQKRGGAVYTLTAISWWERAAGDRVTSAAIPLKSSGRLIAVTGRNCSDS